MHRQAAAAALALVLSLGFVQAQQGPPPIDGIRKSQPGSVTQRVANTDITIVYNRPVARGRAIFGALVPHDKVWHPGADQATTIAFSTGVTLNGQKIDAGKYSLWAIPGADKWTVIFNSSADVWHSPYPGEATDVLRLDIAPEKGAHMETLAYYFPVVEGRQATLRLHWGDVIVPLSIAVP